MNDSGTNVNARVLTMQIIAGALVMGVLVFAGIVLAQGAWGRQPADSPLMSYLVVGMLVLEMVPFAMVSSFVTPESIRKAQESGQGGQRLEGDDLLLSVFQTRMIIRYALFEGVAFFGLIAFMGEGHRWVLAVVGALVVAMLLMFPTKTKVTHWLEAERMRGDFDSDANS